MSETVCFRVRLPLLLGDPLFESFGGVVALFDLEEWREWTSDVEGSVESSPLEPERLGAWLWVSSVVGKGATMGCGASTAADGWGVGGEASSDFPRSFSLLAESME